MFKHLQLLALGLVLCVLVIGAKPVAAQSEGQIGGIVYQDTNGNGIREEGEEGIQDVEVTFNSGGWSTTVSTDDKGAFSIPANPATWTVTISVPSGYTAPKTSTEVFIEKAGDAVTNLEFGLIPQTEEGGEILPSSGAVISSRVFVGVLLGVMALGFTLILIGQRRGKSLSQ